MQLKSSILLAFILIFAPIPLLAQNEQLTITTYYPSPYGSYDELTTAGDTYLATRAGSNVGIGTTAPTAKLDVADLLDTNIIRPLVVRNLATTGGGGNSGVGIQFISHLATLSGAIDVVNDRSGQTSMRFSTFTGEKMRISSIAGKVGIGTTNPNTGLEVFSPDWSPLRIGSNYRFGAGIDLLPDNTYPGFSIWAGKDTNYANKAFISRKTGVGSSAELVAIDNNGNVGIGTISPQATQASPGATDGITPRNLKLDVSKNIITDDVYLRNPVSGSARWASEEGGSPWPAGSYCIMLGASGACPVGFASPGYLCLDTEDDNGMNRASGSTGGSHLGSGGLCGGSSAMFYFCCKNDP